MALFNRERVSSFIALADFRLVHWSQYLLRHCDYRMLLIINSVQASNIMKDAILSIYACSETFIHSNSIHGGDCSIAARIIRRLLLQTIIRLHSVHGVELASACTDVADY